MYIIEQPAGRGISATAQQAAASHQQHAYASPVPGLYAAAYQQPTPPTMPHGSQAFLLGRDAGAYGGYVNSGQAPLADHRDPGPLDGGHLAVRIGAAAYPSQQQLSSQGLVPDQQLQEKPLSVNAAQIFRKPGRFSRPERFVVILRGLPGSGKSHLARALRDVEERQSRKRRGGDAAATPVGPCYVYDPAMEEVYRASMLKAFRKTLDEGRFPFIIAGYEVYVLEPAASANPSACAARNVHGFSTRQVADMAAVWEPLPSHYLQLDVSALFREDVLDAADITEVEMDADDMQEDAEEHDATCRTDGSRAGGPVGRLELDGGEDSEPHSKRWKQTVGGRQQGDQLAAQGNDSEDEGEDEAGAGGGGGGALAGLMQAYSSDTSHKSRRKQQGLRVRWPDVEQEEGRSAGGSGSGSGRTSEGRRKFLVQLHAERAGFKDALLKRRQRLDGVTD
eukprot:jgi/Mesen1/6499/ME000332S05501